MIAFLVFLMTIGILVTFHEFGHYLFARIFKVKVITFSIGFGPKLFKFQSKYNEWCISAIPLGGYVKMLDEREGEVESELKHLAFNNKKPYQKIIIAAAGPVFNLLFAFLAYYILSVAGIPELKPVVASVNSQISASNNIRVPENSLIKSINNIPVYSWSGADKVFNQQVKKSHIVKLNIVNTDKEQVLNLDLQQVFAHYNSNLYLEHLGLYPYKYISTIAYIEPASAAMKADLQVNDEILGINGKKITDWFTLADIIKSSPSKLLIFDVKRQNKVLQIKVTPDSSDNDGQLIGKVGIMPTLDQSLVHANSFVHRYSLIAAFSNAWLSTYNVAALNLSGLYGIVTGKVSARDLGGPITIAKVGSGALAQGFKNFIDFLALISIGLAVMNLLPIPVLDGGHILIYIIEWITGKEVTHQVQAQIFKVGFVLLIGVSFLAIYNDILRL